MNSQQKNPNKHDKVQVPTRRSIGLCLLKSVLALAILGLIFLLLWNWAGVSLFAFPSLTYLQAVAAVATTGLLCLVVMAAKYHRRTRPRSHSRHFCSQWVRCCPGKGGNSGE